MSVATLPDDLADALADALGRVVADVQREWRRDVERLSAESRAIVAELRADVVTLKAEMKDAGDRQAARVADAIMALPVPQDGAAGKGGADGKDGAPGERGADGVDGIAGTDGKDGAPGKDADPDLVAGIVTERLSVEISDAIRSDVELIRADVAAIGGGVDEKIAAQVSLKIGELPDMVPVIAEMVADEVAKLPPAEPGKSVDPEELRATVIAEIDAAVKALPVPADGHTPTTDELAPLVEAAVSRAVAALPVPQDGESVDPAEVERMVASHVMAEVAKLPPAEPGKSIEPADVADMIAAEVTRAVAALPVPQDGEDGEPGKDGTDGRIGDPGEPGKDGAAGLDGKDGKAVDLEEVRVLAVAEVERALSSADDCAPDYLAETVSKAISTLAESPPIAMTSAPSIVLNISGGADRRPSSKTITTRRDDVGNLIAEVVES